MGKLSNETKVALIKEYYPAGTRVKLISMEDSWSKLHAGCTGTVAMVDDIGTIHVKWDNGSTLGLIYGEDSFEYEQIPIFQADD